MRSQNWNQKPSPGKSRNVRRKRTTNRKRKPNPAKLAPTDWVNPTPLKDVSKSKSKKESPRKQTFWKLG